MQVFKSLLKNFFEMKNSAEKIFTEKNYPMKERRSDSEKFSVKYFLMM